MKKLILAAALALTALTVNVRAQDTNVPPPRAGGPGRGPGGGVHILPPRAAEQLNLTADQKKQVADLEIEVKAKLEKILTADQLQQLKQMHPPQRSGGRNGGGNNDGGPGGNGPAGPPPADQ